MKVFSGYYLARFAHADWLNLMVQATKQDSNVSTLGGSAVAGRGTTIGGRMLFNLPALDGYTQSATFGVDYKKFDQTVNLDATSSAPATTIVTPITYYPIVASYNGTWQDEARKATTALEAGVTFHFRGVGSSDELFNDNRYNASGSFLIFHADVAHTHEIGLGFQTYGRVHGQLADQPLLSGEQQAGGGLDTVRGYREAEEVGDSGVFGTIEFRSPSLLQHVAGVKADLRLLVFGDAGWLKVIDPLPEQKNHFDLASYGGGLTFQLADHFNASVYASVPLKKQGETLADELRVLFQGTLNY
ncbi:MAG: ShlB/FhaC/HecB family hemolysin secretion/activation protein [Lacunisphaera sp.]